LTFKLRSLNLVPAHSSLRAAFTHWLTQTQPSSHLYASHFESQARTRSFLALAAISVRFRSQLLKTAFWDIKDHADALKKNSIQAMLMEGGAKCQVAHRGTLDLVRLDGGQRARLIAAALRKIGGTKQSVRRYFQEWHLQTQMQAQKLAQQRHQQVHAQQRRRWENPKIKQRYVEQALRCALACLKTTVRRTDTTLEWAERKRAFDRWKQAAQGGDRRLKLRKMRLLLRKVYTGQV
jgi:hypothetical protein